MEKTKRANEICFGRIRYKVFVEVLLLATLCSSMDAFAQQAVVLQYKSGTYSFTIPDGVTSIIAEGWGGGGGGGYSTSNGQSTGGGGGGAYTLNTLNIEATGDSRFLELTVGVGGNGGVDNKNGASSIVKVGSAPFLEASGGKGVAENSTTGGLGGLKKDCYPNGTKTWKGGDGGSGNGKGVIRDSGGGGGGAGSMGNGGDGKDGVVASSSSAIGGDGGNGEDNNRKGGNGGTGAIHQASGATYAASGDDPGGGGGGGKSPDSAGGKRNGGNGGSGKIIIYLTLSAPDILINGNNCVGATLTSSSIVGVTSFHWNKDNVDVGSRPSIDTTQPGVYTLTVIYSFNNNVYGASANDVSLTSAPVTIHPKPAAPVIYRISNHQ